MPEMQRIVIAVDPSGTQAREAIKATRQTEPNACQRRTGKIGMPKILLVEDDEMNRDMLSRRLLSRGYEVAMAVDGAQAVAMAQGERPELILMDMSLPVIDGWQATRQIRALEATRHIPIIALTAHAMAGDREKAMEAGCDDYDTKPIELPRLIEKIEALLTRSSH
jgi:CheY-like chemotaxis protein